MSYGKHAGINSESYPWAPCAIGTSSSRGWIDAVGDVEHIAEVTGRPISAADRSHGRTKHGCWSCEAGRRQCRREASHASGMRCTHSGYASSVPVARPLNNAGPEPPTVLDRSTVQVSTPHEAASRRSRTATRPSAAIKNPPVTTRAGERVQSHTTGRLTTSMTGSGSSFSPASSPCSLRARTWIRPSRAI